jgi:hypothetical protein
MSELSVFTVYNRDNFLPRKNFLNGFAIFA